MKKAVAFLIGLVIIASQLQGFAYNYPQSFWGMNENYSRALANNDYNGIIQYGNQIITLMKNEPDCEEKTDVLITRYNAVANAYAKLGSYDKSAEVYRELYNYGQPYIDKYYEYIKGAEVRIPQYSSEITMYTDKGESTWYRAVNEKKNGVLFGVCSNGETRNELKNESMVLTYQELGQNLLPYNESIVRKAAASGCAVEFALNCPNQGDDIRRINKMGSYLREISDLFNEYSDVPVYLRFAAEFDVWENKADPHEFKEAFRYVSDYFKDRHDNVAVVWSPSHASGWYIDRNDYYPGDEYVDWVGVSLYADKYYKGDKYAEEINEIAFESGINSNPVIAVRDIVETYGDRKPIMISECGVGHKVSKTGEDTRDFAIHRLNEYLSYLPMVYPQIKLIAYFDWYVGGGVDKSDYRLSENAELQKRYLKLVKGERFIQNGFNVETGYCNRPVYNGIKVDSIFEVGCYAHSYGATLKQVTYYIDNEYAGTSYEIPYKTLIDGSEYSGNHRLKAIALFDDGNTLATESDIYINKEYNDITVEIDGDEVEFDREPILYNDRTMVPMRKIFEELGAKVTWDDANQTAIGKKGDRTVKVTIGEKIMYVNNKKVELDTAPMVLSARTLVPARAVAEGMGCTVDWNERHNLVSITPKVFTWSDWDSSVPSHVDNDLYYIEEKTEYRYRTRDKEYYTSDYYLPFANYVKEEEYYGKWSEWQDQYIASSSTLEVETRKQSSPKKYYFGHYCTGNEEDEDYRYKTSPNKWWNGCDYHTLGWYDYLLDTAPDGVGYVQYKDNGDFKRCSNTCYRWYILETDGGEYTQYRSRPIYTEYTYWEWDSWSDWSRWDEDDPYDYYDWYDDSVDVDERTVYRYKEKG